MERFKHIYVKEVVREPRMNFQRVPKLGSFMAIPLIYKSCLFDEALNEAVTNFQEVSVKIAHQEQEIEAWENQQQSAREAAGANFVEEPREWPQIKLDEFRTEEMKYVVCLDTMGQDRELTEAQKRFALDTVERYIKIWEKEERVALAADRDRRIETLESQEGDGHAQHDALLSQGIATEVEEYEFKEGAPDAIYFQKTFEKDVEEDGHSTMPPVAAEPPAKGGQHAPPVTAVTQEVFDEELRDIETKYKILKVLARKFLKSQEWIAMITNLLQYRVMRYPQIIQSLMFLTGSKREDICFPNTNKLCWKWIRDIKPDQIPKAMLAYQMIGETKDREILPYQSLVYCEMLISGVVAEEVEQYHVGLGKLYKWLTTAIAGRKMDITRRLIATRKAKEDRQAKIEKEEDRKLRREDYIIEKRHEWETDN